MKRTRIEYMREYMREYSKRPKDRIRKPKPKNIIFDKEYYRIKMREHRQRKTLKILEEKRLLLNK